MKKLLLALLLALAPGLAQAQVGTVQGRAANGAAVSGNPVWVCATDGTNCRAIRSDAAGTLLTSSVITNTVSVNCIGCSAASQVSANIYQIGGNATTNYLSTVIIGTVTTSLGTVLVTPAASPWATAVINTVAVSPTGTTIVSVNSGNAVLVNCITGCTSGTGGVSVNIIDVGGNAVTTTLPVSISGAALFTATGSPANVFATNTVTTSATGTTGVSFYGLSPVLVAPATSPWNVTVAGSPYNVITTPAASPAAVIGVDPCSGQNKSNFGFGTTAATSLQLVAGSAGKKVYVCSISLVTSSAATYSIIEGTGANCASGTSASVWGALSPSTGGLPLGSNGGWTQGSGNGSVGQTATSSNGICVLPSASSAFGGNVTYVQQ